MTRPRIPVRLEASCAIDRTCPDRWNVSTTIRRSVGHSRFVPITRSSLESSSTVTALLAASACWEGISAINRWQATGHDFDLGTLKLPVDEAKVDLILKDAVALHRRRHVGQLQPHIRVRPPEFSRNVGNNGVTAYRRVADPKDGLCARRQEPRPCFLQLRRDPGSLALLQADSGQNSVNRTRRVVRSSSFTSSRSSSSRTMRLTAGWAIMSRWAAR